MEALLALPGLLLLLVVPGWFLTRLLFPERDVATRAVLSVALSVSLNGLGGSVLALLGLFRPGPVFGLALGLSAVCAAAQLLVQRQRA